MRYFTPYAKAIVALLAPELTTLAASAQQQHLDLATLGWSALHGLVLAILVWAVPNTPVK